MRSPSRDGSMRCRGLPRHLIPSRLRIALMCAIRKGPQAGPYGPCVLRRTHLEGGRARDLCPGIS